MLKISQFVLLLFIFFSCIRNNSDSPESGPNQFFNELDSAILVDFIPKEVLIKSPDYNYSAPLNIEYKGYALYVVNLDEQDAQRFDDQFVPILEYMHYDSYQIVGKTNKCSEIPIFNPHKVKFAGFGLNVSEEWKLNIVNQSCRDVLLTKYKRNPGTEPGYINGYFTDLESNKVFYFILVY